MTIPDVVDRLAHVLRQAGVPCEKRDTGLRCVLALPHGRRQAVDMEPAGRTPGGHDIIQFFSPCQRLVSGFFGDLSGIQARRLLKFNSRLPVGYFCIKDINGQRYLGVRATQMLDTMDDEELRTHLDAVATLADQWEERMNKDEF